MHNEESGAGGQTGLSPSPIVWVRTVASGYDVPVFSFALEIAMEFFFMWDTF